LIPEGVESQQGRNIQIVEQALKFSLLEIQGVQVDGVKKDLKGEEAVKLIALLPHEDVFALGGAVLEASQVSKENETGFTKPSAPPNGG
jgi:hypothetical protein